MKIIYIKETEDTCDIVKRIILKIKKFLNVIKVEEIDEKTIYCLPIFKDTKISRYRMKKISNKINKLLEEDGSNTIALSEYLGQNQLLKNYLYSLNINCLDGRYLFKFLIYNIIEYLFKTKKRVMELRGDFITC